MLIPFCSLFLLRSFCAVFRTALQTVCYALGVKRSANDVVTYTRQVTYTSASDKNDGVLLQVVSDTGDIHGRFKSVGQTDTRDLTESRVRLLRAGRVNSRAYASLLRCAQIGCFVGKGIKSFLEHRRLGFIRLITSALSDKLVKGWHRLPPFIETLMFTQNEPKLYFCVTDI